MQGYVAPIKKLAKNNDDFRRVLFTSGKMQLVLMALKPGEAIGSEVHSTHDQFFRIEKGKGRIKIGKTKIMVGAGDAIVVPAGLRHHLCTAKPCRPSDRTPRIRKCCGNWQQRHDKRRIARAGPSTHQRARIALPVKGCALLRANGCGLFAQAVLFFPARQTIAVKNDALCWRATL